MSVWSRVYQRALRPALFLLPAEAGHGAGALALRALGAVAPLPRPWRFAPSPSLRVSALGRTFSTPLGVAAGFDKSATLYPGLFALGFASVEVGTVTARAQPGNPRPRLFRLPRDRALINRMGFNNPGCEAVARALSARRAPEGLVLGVNLGKSKVTPLSEAAGDYAESARALAPFAHYLVLNVSSPNTPGLRSLQSVEALGGIVRAVREAVGDALPVLVKVAPDLADEDLDAVVDLALSEGLSGIVATNTTVRRDGLATPEDSVRALGEGGLSGKPLRARSLEVISRVYARARGRLVVVGAGGIATADDAWAALEAGATLLQVYTALVYEGPLLARELARGLEERLAREGLPDLTSVVGRGVRGSNG